MSKTTVIVVDGGIIGTMHALATCEAQSYARLRRLIAEPGTQIQGYDESG